MMQIEDIGLEQLDQPAERRHFKLCPSRRQKLITLMRTSYKGKLEFEAKYEIYGKTTDRLEELLYSGLLYRMRKLSFANLKMDDFFAYKLYPSLGRAYFEDLRELSIADNQELYKTGSTAICYAIIQARMTNIEVLNISNNQFAEEGGIALAKAIEKTPLSKLRHLNMSVNYLVDEAFTEISKALCKANCKDLEKLEIQDNSITDESVIIFGQELQKLNAPKLRHINLAQNFVAEEGMDPFVECVTNADYPELEYFNLNDNSAPVTGAFLLLAQHMIKNPNRVLDLRFEKNNLENDALIGLGAMIRSSVYEKFTFRLQLKENKYDGEAAYELCSALEKANLKVELLELDIDTSRSGLNELYEKVKKNKK